MRKKLFHRSVALLLTLAMLLVLLPTSALAAVGDGRTSPGTAETETSNEGGGDPIDPPVPEGPEITFSKDIRNNGIILTLGTSLTLGEEQVKISGFPEGTTYLWTIRGGDQVKLTGQDTTEPTLAPQRVTANAVTLTVTARYTPEGETVVQSLSQSCAVQVQYALPDRLTLGRALMELDVGNDPAQASITAIQWVKTASGADQDGLCDNSQITWSVGDSAVLSLTEAHGATNHVIAKKPGETEVVATVTGKDGGKLTASCIVTVTGLLVYQVTSGSSRVEVTDRTVTVPVGSEVRLECGPVGGKFNGTNPVWDSSSQGVAFISSGGRVTTQAEGSTRITVMQAGYAAYCTILVVPNTVGSISTAISGDQNLALYSLLSDLNQAYREAMSNAGKPADSAGLSYVTNLSVPTDQGVLYYNYVSPSNHGYGVGGSELYYVNPGVGGRGLAGVTLVPNQGFNGEAVIQYSGYDANRNSFVGTIRVAVTASKDVTYFTPINTPIDFMMDDFNAVHLGATGRDIRYVTFELPDPKQGTLYYDYLGTGEYSTLVTANDRFGRVTSPYLDRVRFVPAADFAGTVRIAYHVTDTGYAVSSGQVSVQVSSLSGVSTEIKYVSQRGEDRAFQATDFSSLCQKALDGENLDYLYFTLPDSSLGTLWYRYNSTSSRSRVTASARYYRNNSSTRPGVSGVYFEPAADTVGVVTIPFMAYSTGGNRFQGTVTIQYNDIGEGELNYYIKANEAVIFNAPDFNELCLNTTGNSFDYVRFDQLPNATAQGSLHSNYNSAGSTGSRITNLNSQYTRTGGLSRVAFIPVTSFSGTVSIPFTAYKSDGGRVFTGVVNIYVEGIGDFTVRYDTFSGRAVQFDAESFAAACQRVTGSSLNYVRFELASSARGKLYYNYSEDKTNNTTVNSDTSYYRDSSYSRRISDVSFVPDASFTGTLTFNYTGVASNNARYAGTIEVRVSPTVAQTIDSEGTSLPVSMNAAAFYQACSQVLPDGLSYIEFTSLPAASQGAMYWNYDPPRVGTQVTTGTRYYYSGTPGINWLTFVPKAEFSGVVSVSYRAYGRNGLSGAGTLNLTISSAATACHFRDMAMHAWAAPSVEFLYQSGIVRGTNADETEYSPTERITRGQFTAMLCRAFGLETASTASFPDVPANEYYAKAIATAKDLRIVTGGADGLFRPDEALPRQEAMLMLYRAMSVAGYRLPSSGANLSAYPDGWQVGQEYRTAVSVMIQMGVMRGDNNSRLLPADTLSRAEMAVVMHRAMTLQRS